MAVHQLLPTFSAGDATGQAAVHLQLLLRRLGIYGELYAGEVKDGLESLASPWETLHPSPQDLVLYHHGIGSGMSARLMHLRCRRGVVFHNISPIAFYRNTDLAGHLTSGRAQLAAMANHVDLALGVSEFNSAELVEAGYRNVHTVPLFVEPQRFALEKAHPGMLARLKRPSVTLLYVGRVVPHKRFEDLLALHEEVLRIRPSARLLLVGGFAEGESYYRSLVKRSKSLTGVHFLGRLQHSELVAAYRASTVFVSMSEHEGFGVPLLEAMAAEVPVLAYAAAAVSETLGGHGVLFNSKDFGILAHIVVQLSEESGLRTPLLNGQAQRLEELSGARAATRLAEALRTVEKMVKPPRRRPIRTKEHKPRVGIIVQRFGEVGGGAERHAELIADKLLPHFDLTVMTTCARNHLTWANEFPSGPQRVGEFSVLRFPTRRSREMQAFNALSRDLFGVAQDRVHEERWVSEQGPCVPGLYQYLEEEGAQYDAFIGFTYLYSPIVWGASMVASKMLLVPTAHDEPPLSFDVFRDVFERPRALLCNTPEEAELIHQRFPHHSRIRVVGVGIDASTSLPSRFAERFNQSRPYLFYVGRIEEGKGLPELMRHHAQLVREVPDAPDLLLAGRGSMQISGKRVRYLGPISEQEKIDGLAGAIAAAVPSRYESLSLLALEAFAQGTPVLVNGASEVLVGQVTRSGAGATYQTARQYRAGVEAITQRRPELERKARDFAQAHRWERVVAAYREEIHSIMECKR